MNGVVNIVIYICDSVGNTDNSAFQCCRFLAVCMTFNAVSDLPGEVQALALFLNDINHSDALLIVAKSAVANTVECTLTCMAERGVSEVMTECNRLSQRLVKSEADRNSPRNLSDLKGVGQSSSVVITLR